MEPLNPKSKDVLDAITAAVPLPKAGGQSCAKYVALAVLVAVLIGAISIRFGILRSFEHYHPPAQEEPHPIFQDNFPRTTSIILSVAQVHPTLTIPPANNRPMRVGELISILWASFLPLADLVLSLNSLDLTIRLWRTPSQPGDIEQAISRLADDTTSAHLQATDDEVDEVPLPPTPVYIGGIHDVCRGNRHVMANRQAPGTSGPSTSGVHDRPMQTTEASKSAALCESRH